MGRNSAGWFKCWRNALDKDLFDNMILWSIWHALLHMASWGESQILWEGKQRVLPPGTILFSPREFSDRWGVSKSVILKWLNHLRDTGRISTESCPRGTLVTICNWYKYQSDDAVNEITTSPQRVHNETLNKNIRNKNKEKYSSAEVASPASCGAIDPFDCEGTREALSKVKRSVQERWLAAYADANWIKQELLKALAWEAANPRKRSKDFGRFMTNWLSNGWERYRKTIPTGALVNTTPINLEDIK